MQAQYEHIEKRLHELKGKVDGNKLTKESEYFDQYEEILNQMHDLHNRYED